MAQDFPASAVWLQCLGLGAELVLLHLLLSPGMMRKLRESEIVLLQGLEPLTLV